MIGVISHFSNFAESRRTIMELISNIRNFIRSVVFSGIMIFGVAGLIYTPASIAGDDSSMSGKSGQGSSATDKSSSDQGRTAGGQGSQQKKQSGSKSGQTGSSTSRSRVLEEERTGVTGDTPSGGRAETSGQKRGPSGY
jgi:hypothetical protein